MLRTSATNHLLEILKEKLSLNPGAASHFAIGYSGGRDSTVLLWLLKELIEGPRLTAVHVDHRWRPPQEREQENSFVRELCMSWSIPLVEMTVEGTPHSEAQARALRYGLWDEWMKTDPPEQFFLAHHRDDQAETVLMRLLKGRSWGGLSGIPARRGRYSRPLLDIPRSLLIQLAEEQRLPFFEDSTNADDKALRNFLRTTILPQLTQRFPRADQALASFAGYWREHFLPAELNHEWEPLKNGFSIGSDLWKSWTPWKRADQLEALAAASDGRRPTRRFLEKVCQDRPRTQAQGGGWVLASQGSRVEWTRAAPAVRLLGFCALLPVSRWTAAGKWMVFWGKERAKSGESYEISDLDPGQVLVLRTRLEGWTPPNLTSESAKMRARRADLWLFQKGSLIAVINLSLKGVVCTQMTAPKLHKDQFFVTLVKRSDYERR